MAPTFVFVRAHLHSIAERLPLSVLRGRLISERAKRQKNAPVQQWTRAPSEPVAIPPLALAVAVSLPRACHTKPTVTPEKMKTLQLL